MDTRDVNRGRGFFPVNDKVASLQSVEHLADLAGRRTGIKRGDADASGQSREVGAAERRRGGGAQPHHGARGQRIGPGGGQPGHLRPGNNLAAASIEVARLVTESPAAAG